MSEQWYFAYGSNLKKERLAERIGQWKKTHKAILKDYKLTFAKGWRGHDNGKADILPHRDSEVKGAVYFITRDQFASLDGPEGVRLGVYKRIPVNVEINGQPVPAQTYVMQKEICLYKPSSAYLEIILSGLAQHGYDESVAKEVRMIANLC